MSSKPAASSPRSPWAFRCLVLAIVLAGIALAWRSRGVLAGSGAKGAASAGAQTARARRGVAVTARPRAGIQGRVLDPEQQPVPRASVCAFFQPQKVLTTAEARTPRCVKTDKGGEYALDDLFPATPIALSASAARFVPTSYRGADGAAEIRLADGEQRAGVDIALGGGGVEIHGSVGDATGGAVSGAVVIGEEGNDRAVTASDDQGAFSLWVAPGALRVQATAPGYAQGAAYGPAPGHFFKIALLPGSTLAGRAVIAGEETPVPGVMIDGIPMEGSATRASARTDEEGRFRIEGLSPGRYRVEAASEGREGYSKSSITLGLGETSSEVIVEMEPAFVVRGRVVDKATGKPCPGGRVIINDHSQDEYSEAAIDPDGWARMASVIPGTYRADVTCNGFVSGGDYPLVVVKDRDLPPLRWEVDKGATVRVDLVDRQGKPVPKGSVWANAREVEGAWAETDHPEPDGTFLLSGLKPGKYEVAARVGQSTQGGAQVTVAAHAEERVRIEVPVSGVIEGTVEDDARRPVANVEVRATGAGFAMAMTLDDGTFTLNGLPSGEYEVRTADRSASRSQDEPPGRVAKVTLSAPEHVRVKLVAEARGGVIEGRVVDGAGKPVTDGFIDHTLSSTGVPRSGGWNRPPIVTDTAGHFTVEGLADGTYDLRAYRQGGSEGSTSQIKTGSRDVVINLADGGSISGTLTAAGAPVDRFNVSARNAKTGLSRGEFFYHTGGAFTIPDLPAGTYSLDAETPQGLATVEVALADGEQKAGVAIALTMRQSVDGTLVTLETGAPIAGARLSVGGNGPLSPMNNDGHNNKSGPDGRFHLEGVLPGSSLLVVSPTDPRYAFVQVPIVVPDGTSSTDVGAVRVPQNRLAPGQPNGMLGVYSAGGGLRVFPPASEAGIQSGDVVVSIDGYGVQGQNSYLFQPLTLVPSGRAVTFTLADGRSVTVTAR